jgi:hypothetical protein
MKTVAIFWPRSWFMGVLAGTALALQGCNLGTTTPSTAAAYLVSCEKHYRKGHFVEARKDCFRAIELPANTRTHEAATRRLVVLSLMLDRAEEGIKLGQLLSLIQDDERSSALVGVAYHYAGHYVSASRWYLRCGSQVDIVSALIGAAEERIKPKVDSSTASALLSTYCPANGIAAHRTTAFQG